MKRRERLSMDACRREADTAAAAEYAARLETAGGIPRDSAAAGLRLARRIFEKRGNHSEAHITEEELAVMLAAAYEIGKDEYIEGLSLDDLDELRARFP